jgi:hypothetical protein
MLTTVGDVSKEGFEGELPRQDATRAPFARPPAARRAPAHCFPLPPSLPPPKNHQQQPSSPLQRDRRQPGLPHRRGGR